MRSKADVDLSYNLWPPPNSSRIISEVEATTTTKVNYPGIFPQDCAFISPSSIIPIQPLLINQFNSLLINKIKSDLVIHKSNKRTKQKLKKQIIISFLVRYGIKYYKISCC